MSSSSIPQSDYRQVKQCLQLDGMQWKTRSYILRTPQRDIRILAALSDRGVGLRTQDVHREFVSLIRTATRLARCRDSRDFDSAYEFVSAVRRRHALGRYLPELLFVELFRAVVNGRRRFLRRTNSQTRRGTRTCPLAIEVDRFLREAGAIYCDAEVFLRLNEENA